MRGWVWLTLALMPVSPAIARQEPPLPPWEEAFPAQVGEDEWGAGELLLGTVMIPDAEEETTQASALEIERPTAEELAEDETPPAEIAAKFLPEYFDERPSRFLIDPQGLLSTVEYHDRVSFLEYHAGDSTIDLFIYVFGGDQEIPGEVREEEMIERFFSEGRPAAIVFYYLGFPQRTEVYLSPSLTDVVSAAEQRRALQSSVAQAFEKVHAEDQLEALLVQMSIRIYWMERMLEGEAEPGANLAGEPQATRETAAGADAEAAGTDPWLREMWRRWGLPALGVVVGVSGLLGFAGWWKSRARYRFPEFEVEPRLGGGHAAGVGAVISFASAALPPASQRDQMPDYLRRA